VPNGTVFHLKVIASGCQPPPRETTFGVLRTGLPVTFRQGVAGTWDDFVPHDPLPKWLCPSGLPAKGTASLVESRCKELRPSCTPAKGLTLWTLSVGRCPSPPRQRARPLGSANGLRPTRANAPAAPARPRESFVVADGHLGASASSPAEIARRRPRRRNPAVATVKRCTAHAAAPQRSCGPGAHEALSVGDMLRAARPRCPSDRLRSAWDPRGRRHGPRQGAARRGPVTARG
jgi:hypothetical protein